MYAGVLRVRPPLQLGGGVVRRDTRVEDLHPVHSRDVRAPLKTAIRDPAPAGLRAPRALSSDGEMPEVEELIPLGVAEEGPMRGSIGAWLAWPIMEHPFDNLGVPITRVADPNTLIPFSPR